MECLVVVPFIPSLAVATSPKALAWIWQEEHETVLSADRFLS
jgi:hypothetical protein